MVQDRSPTRLVVFTDLDGTLLDRFTYDPSEALPALDLIRNRGIPLVFCSSKTRAEQEELRTRLGIDDPFIVEDGGAVYIEQGYFHFAFEYQRTSGPYRVVELGVAYDAVRRAISDVEAETGIPMRGYGDMEAEEISAVAGLDPESAERAKNREYEETLVIDPTPEELARLERAFSARGLTMTRGSRFLGVKGRHDKGTAVRRLIELFRRQHGDFVSIGIGDGQNDEPLLTAVDRPHLVEREGGGWVRMPVAGLITVAGVGPVGWRNAIFDLLC